MINEINIYVDGQYHSWKGELPYIRFNDHRYGWIDPIKICEAKFAIPVLRDASWSDERYCNFKTCLEEEIKNGYKFDPEIFWPNGYVMITNEEYEEFIKLKQENEDYYIVSVDDYNFMRNEINVLKKLIKRRKGINDKLVEEVALKNKKIRKLEKKLKRAAKLVGRFKKEAEDIYDKYQEYYKGYQVMSILSAHWHNEYFTLKRKGDDND